MHKLLPSLLVLASCASTAEPPPPAPRPAGAPTMEEAMATMQRLAQPGPEHEVLGELAGTFDAHVTMWMEPGTEPIESTGTMETVWVLGGRYLQGSYSGELLGQPFHGVSLLGYDNALEEYQGTWVDTMGTAIQPVSRGARSGRTIRLERRMYDPMLGTHVDQHEVLTLEGPDRHVYEMFLDMPGEGLFKTMEIVYTRRSRE